MFDAGWQLRDVVCSISKRGRRPLQPGGCIGNFYLNACYCSAGGVRYCSANGTVCGLADQTGSDKQKTSAKATESLKNQHFELLATEAAKRYLGIDINQNRH